MAISFPLFFGLFRSQVEDEPASYMVKKVPKVRGPDYGRNVAFLLRGHARITNRTDTVFFDCRVL